MLRYRANCFLFIFLFIVGIKASGQTSTISNPTSEHDNNPYSRYGLGMPGQGSNIVLQGMGNVSSAYAAPYTINTDNPASYAYLKLTTYEGGMYGTVRNVATNTLNYSTGTATLSYMNIGIPLGKNAGMCIGLKPVSHMFYNLADTTVSDLGLTQGLYSGSGSVNLFYLGGAYQYKSFSLGFNAGYMFGQTRNSVVYNNIDTLLKTYNSDFSRFSKVGGIYWNAGLMYETKLKKDLSLRAGATLSLQQELNTTVTEYWIGTYSLIDSFIEDTAYAAPSVEGKTVIPMSYSLGVHLFNTDKWTAGLDYTATQWTQYKNMGVSDSLANAYKISIGGEYTPNASNIRNYFARATYRLGFYYGQDRVYLMHTNMNYYGFTAGTSLPIRRSLSRLHLGIDVGSLGTKSNNLIKESYVRFSVGFSFNDRWFVKRQYD